MAEISKQTVRISAEVTLTISEVELRALDALAGYGGDAFIKAFYRELGESYLKPYESGLRSFLASIQGCASLARDAEECRTFMGLTNAERLAQRQAKAKANV